VRLGEPNDPFFIKRRTANGDAYSGIDYNGAASDAVDLARRHQLEAADAHDGAVLRRVGNELEADLTITNRQWLLAERTHPNARHLTDAVSAEEALALIGLYLRWHRQPVIIGGGHIRWNPTGMRRSVAYTAMPAFERWNRAGRAWHDTTPGGDLRLERLNQTLLTRVSRAFEFRDSIFALSATMADAEPEELLCELDSLLFSLVGAFDVAAVVVDLVLGLASRPQQIGWQKKEWRAKVEPVAKDLYDDTAADTEIQRVFLVLRLLRNSVHNEALSMTRDDGQFYVALDTTTQEKLRDLLRGAHTGWSTTSLGIRVQPPGGATAGRWLGGTGRYSVTVRRSSAPRLVDPLDGHLVVDVRQFANRIFPATLQGLNSIMRLTPLDSVPGHNPAIDTPSRINLPWQYSDTTGHRLRLLYGVTDAPQPEPAMPGRQ
jgi:hypothetical protein